MRQRIASVLTTAVIAAVVSALVFWFFSKNIFNAPTPVTTAQSKTVSLPQPVAATGKGEQLAPELAQKLKPLIAALNNPKPTIQRINTLMGVAQRLTDYSKAKGLYPDSGGKLVELAKALPILKAAGIDVALEASSIANLKYISDSKSYKLIAVGTGDCAIARTLKPDMVDPKRSAGPLDCLAYGIWTPQGVDF